MRLTIVTGARRNAVALALWSGLRKSSGEQCAVSSEQQEEILTKLREAYRNAKLVRKQIKLMRGRSLEDVVSGWAGFAEEFTEKTMKAIEEAAKLVGGRRRR